MKVKIYKCYLVQVVDNEDNELASEYVFEDRKGALETGRRMKEQLRKEEQWRDDWDRECIRLLTE